MGYNSFKFHVHVIFWEVTKNYQPPKTIAQLFLFKDISTKNHKKKTARKPLRPASLMNRTLETRLQQLFSSQLLQDLRNLAISIHLQDPSSEIDVFSPLGRRWEQVGKPEITNGLELGVESSFVKLRYWYNWAIVKLVVEPTHSQFSGWKYQKIFETKILSQDFIVSHEAGNQATARCYIFETTTETCKLPRPWATIFRGRWKTRHFPHSPIARMQANTGAVVLVRVTGQNRNSIKQQTNQPNSNRNHHHNHNNNKVSEHNLD